MITVKHLFLQDLRNAYAACVELNVPTTQALTEELLLLIIKCNQAHRATIPTLRSSTFVAKINQLSKAYKVYTGKTFGVPAL